MAQIPAPYLYPGTRFFDMEVGLQSRCTQAIGHMSVWRALACDPKQENLWGGRKTLPGGRGHRHTFGHRKEFLDLTNPLSGVPKGQFPITSYIDCIVLSQPVSLLQGACPVKVGKPRQAPGITPNSGPCFSGSHDSHQSLP